MVASEPMDADPGWRLLDAGELLHVDSELRVETTAAFPAPPRQLLTRADLDPRTEASQHP